MFCFSSRSFLSSLQYYSTDDFPILMSYVYRRVIVADKKFHFLNNLEQKFYDDLKESTKLTILFLPQTFIILQEIFHMTSIIFKTFSRTTHCISDDLALCSIIIGAIVKRTDSFKGINSCLLGVFDLEPDNFGPMRRDRRRRRRREQRGRRGDFRIGPKLSGNLKSTRLPVKYQTARIFPSPSDNVISRTRTPSKHEFVPLNEFVFLTSSLRYGAHRSRNEPQATEGDHFSIALAPFAKLIIPNEINTN